jgi:hydroxymethylbilane synthase
VTAAPTAGSSGSVAALRIGTRGSALALAQARAVAALLPSPVELVPITTAGDLNRAGGDKSRWVAALEAALVAGEIDLAVHSAKDVPAELAPGTAIVAAPRRADARDVLVGEPRLRDVGDKSRWTGALEHALLAGEIDVAVHSAKDVPGELAAGTEIVAVPPREDSRDVLVGAASLDALPAGARVGTSALRRRAQLLALRPDLEVVELRGNVDTRLRKRAAGQVDVLVLAAAGLDRLGRRREGGGALVGDVFVPAPGQGAIAVQARAGSAAAEVAGAVSHGRTMACLRAERAAVRELDASCHTPVGIHADHARIRGFAGLPDGSAWLVDEVALGGRRPAGGDHPACGDDPAGGDDPAEFEAAGRALARRMLAAGAADLLRDAEAMAAR